MRRAPFDRLFLSRRVRTRPHEALDAAHNHCDADKIGCWCAVLHTCDASRAVRSRSLATGVAARCSAAGERIIAGHRPIVFGRMASDDAKSVCILQVLACYSTPWAPRSDLHHRSGRGAWSVCVLPHLRLPQLVESPATGDDPRRIRERTAS